MTPRHEIWKLADRLQMDLANAERRLVELRSHLAQLKLPDLEQPEHLCPECHNAGITHDLRGALKLAEHRYVAHDGPLPDHYAAAEAHSDPGDETA
jgi:hypothetical protein